MSRRCAPFELRGRPRPAGMTGWHGFGSRRTRPWRPPARRRRRGPARGGVEQGLATTTTCACARRPGSTRWPSTPAGTGNPTGRSTGARSTTSRGWPTSCGCGRASTDVALRGASMGGYFALAAALEARAGAVVSICPASATGLSAGSGRGYFPFESDRDSAVRAAAPSTTSSTRSRALDAAGDPDDAAARRGRRGRPRRAHPRARSGRPVRRAGRRPRRPPPLRGPRRRAAGASRSASSSASLRTS